MAGDAAPLASAEAAAGRAPERDRSAAPALLDDACCGGEPPLEDVELPPPRSAPAEGAPETELKFRDLKSPGTRVFYLEALAFYSAYFAWFSVPPLMSAIKEELGLSERQVQLSHAACIGGAAVARLVIGEACDRYGARLSHAAVLIASVFSFLLVATAPDWPAFLLARLLLSALGSSPVAMRVHGTVMFDPAIQGFVCCTMIGFGDAGAGVAQLAMPLFRRLFLAAGVPEPRAWRCAMLLPALQLLAAGLALVRFTPDCPQGRWRRRPPPPIGRAPSGGRGRGPLALLAAKGLLSANLWLLFAAYGANSGTEFAILNTATCFFERRFGLSVELAGLVAFAFAPNDLYASVIAGRVSDRLAARRGPAGRKWFAVGTLLAQGACTLLLGLAGVAGCLPAVAPLFLLTAVSTYLTVAAISCLIPLITDERLQLGAANAVVATSGVLSGFCLSFLFGGALSDSQAYACIGVIVLAAAVPLACMRCEGHSAGYTPVHAGEEPAGAAPPKARS